MSVPSLSTLDGLRALVVEDEYRLAGGVRRLLVRVGVNVTLASTVEVARSMLEPALPWDIVLLDQKLPDGDGLELLDRMEQLRTRPALVAVSAYLHESKRSLRLQGYPGVLLPKPFDHADLLLAMGDALMLTARQHRHPEPATPPAPQAPERPAILSFGPIFVELVTQTVTIDGELVDLQPAQFRILAQLLSNPGRALAPEELAESALRGHHADGAANVRFQIHALRRRLGTSGKLIERSEGGYGVGLGTLHTGNTQALVNGRAKRSEPPMSDH